MNYFSPILILSKISKSEQQIDNIGYHYCLFWLLKVFYCALITSIKLFNLIRKRIITWNVIGNIYMYVFLLNYIRLWFINIELMWLLVQEFWKCQQFDSLLSSRYLEIHCNKYLLPKYLQNNAYNLYIICKIIYTYSNIKIQLVCKILSALHSLSSILSSLHLLWYTKFLSLYLSSIKI